MLIKEFRLYAFSELAWEGMIPEIGLVSRAVNPHVGVDCLLWFWFSNYER
jgi:hypothetical protein